MTFKLSDTPKVKYSPLEQQLFGKLALAHLGDKMRTAESKPSRSSDELASATRRKGPNARTIVVGAMRSLAAKAIRNREPWRIKNSPRRGPHAICFWVEKK